MPKYALFYKRNNLHKTLSMDQHYFKIYLKYNNFNKSNSHYVY